MGLVKAMQENKVAVLAHGATGRGNDQMRFERYTNVLAPNMAVYAPWRDPGLLEEFPGRTEMAAYLNKFGIEALQLRWKGAAAATGQAAADAAAGAAAAAADAAKNAATGLLDALNPFNKGAAAPPKPAAPPHLRSPPRRRRRKRPKYRARTRRRSRSGAWQRY